MSWFVRHGPGGAFAGDGEGNYARFSVTDKERDPELSGRRDGGGETGREMLKPTGAPGDSGGRHPAGGGVRIRGHA